MRAVAVFCTVLIALASSAFAGPCADEAVRAEREWALPPGLLGAIGLVESGRVERGRTVAWPFSLNQGGVGYQFPSAAPAIGQIAAWQAAGIRSIDVGCFQVNLLYHPEAFANLEEALDPRANARAAARFLRDLYASSGDWAVAVERYHSSDPPVGQPYARTVMAVWGMPIATPAPPPPPAVLQAAVDAAGVHLPTVVIHLPNQAGPPARSRPVSGHMQRG